MRLSRTLARPTDQLPPREPKPNEVVYHHQLTARTEGLYRALNAHTVEAERADATLYTQMTQLISGVHTLIDVQAQQLQLLSNRHDALDLALAMHRADVASNRLTNRVKRILFRRIF